jgi:phospholipase A1
MRTFFTIKKIGILKGLIILISSFSLLAAESEAEDAGIDPYRPTYFMLQYGTPDPRDDRELYAKFQFGTKQPLAGDYLFFAYTYRALWSITAESAPFKDSSHNPEIFVDIDNKGTAKIGQIGVEHESNGKGGEDSRSWNRIYWEPRLVYRRKEGKMLGFDTFTLHIKGWVKLREELSDNPDILDYYGNGELTAKFYSEENQLALKGRKGLKKDYGNIQVEFMRRITDNLCLYAQLWNGYGESLLDYNKRSTRYGVGLALTR